MARTNQFAAGELAVELDLVGSIDALLAAGADPDARDEYGNTPLLYALCGEGASLESGSFAVQYL